MTHVRGHYRRNGSYVRPHHRRTRPGSGKASSPRSAAYTHSTAIASARRDSTDQTVRVRGHYRDGVYVRPHVRRTGTPAAAAGGGGALLLLLVVLAFLSGGGTDVKDAPRQQPSPSVSPSR